MNVTFNILYGKRVYQRKKKDFDQSPLDPLIKRNIIKFTSMSFHLGIL